ncbi:cystinosin homolog isoform X1 [Bactrocera neohumeralis]|uniref:cystinosin homolog isoform X1 n=1 Tax=Bactrocera tryoni TaxID=59916 RepID=UPI001A95F165|nr:cystinosin homolog isoform X1 [Bactrocera tryoni]XP_039955273.1 cystinosin homolog isoform X1 [Bactrocera tryoni]XP_039955282.1 cystinosin homolog isoform X1 [Bactrocera tryoni]XP_050341074.1 cystinosin homolog isoform X1 [Bactrocera neohumeralis]XP_050341075.1 cystinosin homolog isoform X1 [Bactrocera neohumeralis]
MKSSTGIYSVLRYTKSLIFVISISVALFTQTTADERFTRSSNRSGLTVSTHDLTIIVKNTKTFDVLIRDPLEQDVFVQLVKQHETLVELDPNYFTISASNPQNRTVSVRGLQLGHLEVTATSLPDESWIVDDLFVRITVAKSEPIIYTSIVFGWIYFVAWSISFYPQIFINFRRKSVIGLNFDFLALNIVGFTLYSVFNCGLYWVPSIQDEYASRHPRGMNPVLLNDVVFGLHAMFATAITIIQCFLYERAEQRVSRIASGILAAIAIIVLVTLILAITGVVQWLDFLYYCSYIKLAMIIKYVPQALMNYRRKSTTGWSIGNILLDFTGGLLSMLQMILNAYNYNDWVSIFGSVTKFGMGLFSVLFDVLFILQHYVFYRHSQQLSISTTTNATEVVTDKADEQPRY